ncbi:MAG: pentapeptide repeat-containing protein, partial [Candidatus Angelobacter sp.]
LAWTLVQIITLMVSVVAAAVLLNLANRTLKGQERIPFSPLKLFKRRAIYICVLSIVLLGGSLFFLSCAMMFGQPRFLSKAAAALGYSPSIDLTNTDVSVKPPNWTGTRDDEMNIVKGANLSGQYLMSVHANYAFLVRAQLQGTDMTNASLPQADLRGADLTKANLKYADLSGANLTKASMVLADLTNAKFSSESIIGSRPSGDLVIRVTVSASANVRYASFGGANGLEPEKIKECIGWRLAFYDSDMLKQLGLPPNNNEIVQKQMEAEQQQAKSAATTPPTPK